MTSPDSRGSCSECACRPPCRQLRKSTPTPARTNQGQTITQRREGAKSNERGGGGGEWNDRREEETLHRREHRERCCARLLQAAGVVLSWNRPLSTPVCTVKQNREILQYPSQGGRPPLGQRRDTFVAKFLPPKPQRYYLPRFRAAKRETPRALSNNNYIQQPREVRRPNEITSQRNGLWKEALLRRTCFAACTARFGRTLSKNPVVTRTCNRTCPEDIRPRQPTSHQQRQPSGNKEREREPNENHRGEKRRTHATFSTRNTHVSRMDLVGAGRSLSPPENHEKRRAPPEKHQMPQCVGGGCRQRAKAPPPKKKRKITQNTHKKTGKKQRAANQIAHHGYPGGGVVYREGAGIPLPVAP